MSGLPVWTRQKTVRGSTCHCWGPYTIEKDAGIWYVWIQIMGLDAPLHGGGKYDSFQEAKEATYADCRRAGADR